MKRIHLRSTSAINIILHFIPAGGFIWFAYRSWQVSAGNQAEIFTAGVFAGVMGAMALLILVDACACIKARIKGKKCSTS